MKIFANFIRILDDDQSLEDIMCILNQRLSHCSVLVFSSVSYATN